MVKRGFSNNIVYRSPGADDNEQAEEEASPAHRTALIAQVNDVVHCAEVHLGDMASCFCSLRVALLLMASFAEMETKDFFDGLG